ncbi:hypothetical protein [Rhodobacter sp. SY28-1]|uniref:hypothetical protein n=1 Tax=Rhodobacter sp. SY28-1 TaxID=2562317 RepID=UPI0010C14F8F|nr:hypothetical protein [Rhodobacter sp. SY28-1]
MPGTVQPSPEVLLCCGTHAVTLRASLRAAMALESLPGGIAVVWEDTARQKLTALHAVIRASATDRAGAERLLAHAATTPIGQFAHTAQAACLALLSGFLKAEDQGEATPSSTEPAKPFRDYLADLFRYGTGWLGWPPSEVWNAGIGELEAAFLAHVDRLVKMTPGASANGTATGDGDYTADRLRQIEDQGFDPAFDLEALRALKSRHGL